MVCLLSDTKYSGVRGQIRFEEEGKSLFHTKSGLVPQHLGWSGAGEGWHAVALLED
jgi:hypothetical protein